MKIMQKIIRVWIDDKAVYIETGKGEIYSEQFSDYPRLRNAAPSQRTNFEYDNIGIRWKEIDEDLSYSGFMNKPLSAPALDNICNATFNTAEFANRN
jgi:hypothetical protein